MTSVPWYWHLRMNTINTTQDFKLDPFLYGTTTPFPSNSSKPSRCGNTVHDIELDKGIRLGILYATIIVGIVGSILVLLWMVCNRKVTPRFNHLSRVNSFILNLTIADLSVILLAVLPQLVWEYADREWSAGPAMCRIVKFLQSFSMMSSNYILVVIAIDRHQAIRAPLKESMAVGDYNNMNYSCCTSLGKICPRVSLSLATS